VNTPPPPEGAAPSTPAPDPPAPPDPPVAPPLSDAERARAFSTFRGTALACVLLGLVMLPAAFTDTDRPELRQALALVPARTPLGAMLRATLDFAATAGPTIGVWASVLVGAGGVALVRFSVGRRLLVLAAWDDPDAALYIQGKLYDYLLAGTPFVAETANPEVTDIVSTINTAPDPRLVGLHRRDCSTGPRHHQRRGGGGLQG
jgi:hypothetical protein